MAWQVTRSPRRRGRAPSAAITFVNHLLTKSSFAAKSIPLDQVPVTLNLWLSLHTIRVALGLIASVVGLVAIAR
jgi:hypothetical protein